MNKQLILQVTSNKVNIHMLHKLYVHKLLTLRLFLSMLARASFSSRLPFAAGTHSRITRLITIADVLCSTLDVNRTRHILY